MSSQFSYLDGNAAAGELSKIFAIDVTGAESQCANCGAKMRFAETHLYVQAPGFVARCPVCQYILLRLANVRGRIFIDMRGMTYFSFDTDHA
jgi:hypothetical protein